VTGSATAGVGPGLYFEDLRIGMTASFEKVLGDDEVERFAELSGDVNPAHLDEAFARTTRLGARVVHGMLTASLVSAVLGCRLPGPGCLFVSQTTHFRAPVRPGDTVSARVVLARLDPQRQFAAFDTACTVGETTVLDGSTLLWVPSNHKAVSTDTGEHS
jgi:3-hydroxybutyryl-CoA dehydratase